MEFYVRRGELGEKNHKNFKFEEAWTRESSCDSLVELNWKKDVCALNNIRNVKDALLGSDLCNLKTIYKR